MSDNSILGFGVRECEYTGVRYHVPILIYEREPEPVKVPQGFCIDDFEMQSLEDTPSYIYQLTAEGIYGFWLIEQTREKTSVKRDGTTDVAMPRIRYSMASADGKRELYSDLLTILRKEENNARRTIYDK